MQVLVLDNSVIMKVMQKEDDSEKVKKLMVLKENYMISVLLPDIFPYEFFNKLMRGMSHSQAVKIFTDFTERQASVIPLENDLAESANRLMEKYPQISFYDAAYHALAKAYNALFVTADKKYYALTKKEGNIALLSKLNVKKLAK